MTCAVAPREGAWIETPLFRRPRDFLSVAPREGAWIETLPIHGGRCSVFSSHPVRVRGLKHQKEDIRYQIPSSPPREGAWIETF